MRNHCLLGRCLFLVLGTVLPAGLLLGAGCQGTTTDTNTSQVDSRRTMGNLSVGALCDDQHVCAMDSKSMTPPCVTAHLYDTVGFCAPSCATDNDCDTYLSGLAKCTTMGGALECVLFCDQQHVNTSKVCPDKWSCELVQGPQQSFYMCVPPQDRLGSSDGGM